MDLRVVLRTEARDTQTWHAVHCGVHERCAIVLLIRTLCEPDDLAPVLVKRDGILLTKSDSKKILS